MRAAALLGLLLGLAACGDRVVSRECGWWRPIKVSAADVLTDETAAEILGANRTGARVCGSR